MQGLGWMCIVLREKRQEHNDSFVQPSSSSEEAERQVPGAWCLPRYMAYVHQNHVNYGRNFLDSADSHFRVDRSAAQIVGRERERERERENEREGGRERENEREIEREREREKERGGGGRIER
jgi:hypothetical protein